MPKTYKLIVYTVQAMQLTPDSVDRAALWCGGMVVNEYDANDLSKKFVALNIPTIEGVKRAQEGDYIVKSESGGFCVVPKREFETKYELVG